jgi:hypothetical protein
MKVTIRRKLCDAWLFLSGFIPMYLWYLRIYPLIPSILGLGMILTYTYVIREWECRKNEVKK